MYNVILYTQKISLRELSARLNEENEMFLTLWEEAEQKYGNTKEAYDNYVKATTTITDSEGNTETVSAFASEPEDKKGMDSSQITGTASSYARKYNLNGLFLIDDVKDADTDAYRYQTEQKHEEPLFDKAFMENTAMNR